MNRFTSTRLRSRLALGLIALVGMNAAAVAAASPMPVLMVIANQDFYYQEYAAVRSSIEAQGLTVVVAAGQKSAAVPQGLMSGLSVLPDRALAGTDAANYSAIVFVGGWGSSSYQYAFSGTYYNSAYNGQTSVAKDANRLIGEFLAHDKPVAAVNHGVAAVAWSRVKNANSVSVSPIQGRVVVGPAGGMPGFHLRREDYADGEKAMRWQIETNGALMLNSASLGDPLSASDDVYIDGNIITAENWASAGRFAEAIAASVAANRN